MLAVIIICLYFGESIALQSDESCNATNAAYSEISLIEIDINKFITGNIDQKKAIANIVDEQLRTIGSFRITNHGLSLAKMNKLHDSIKHFFEQTTEFKSIFDTKGVLGANGYEGIGTKNVGYNFNTTSKKDPVESLQFFFFQLLDSEKNKINQYCPDSLFKDIVSYFTDTRTIASILFEIFTLALDLNKNQFEIDMSDVNDTNIINHYFSQFAVWNYVDLDINEPGMDWNEFDKDTRFGVHQDWSLVTIIRNDNIPGLQLKLDGIDNQWYTVSNENISEDSLVINVGEVMAMYTAGYWRAVVHRVSSLSVKRRMTVTSFFGPNMNRIIDELEDCKKCEENRNETVLEKYELPMMFKKHVMARFGGGFVYDEMLPFWL